MLTASFVRTVGERDRIYVVRSDGSEVNWAFPAYGEALPHDLIHLVVEAAFAVGQGFWGRVDAGVDPGAILAEANRRGGRDKFSDFGPAMSELRLAEALANAGWLLEDASATSLHERINQAHLLGSLRRQEVRRRQPRLPTRQVDALVQGGRWPPGGAA